MNRATWILAILALAGALLVTGCDGAPVAQSAPMPEPLAGGAWQATGLCAPAAVTLDMLALVFAPVGNPSSGLGPYTVTIDDNAKTVTVDGPAGADVLQRDIMRCVVGGVDDGRAGIWEGGLYVDRVIERMLPEGETNA